MRAGARAGRAGEILSYTHGADSEAGWLRTVLVHRPGAELKRISPRSRGRLLFDRLPWVSRAQEEHDAFTQILRDHGVEVLYVTELLQDALEYAAARDAAISSALDDRPLGDDLRGVVRDHLAGLDSETLAQALIAGITPAELRAGRGVVYELLDRHDFVLDPRAQPGLHQGFERLDRGPGSGVQSRRAGPGGLPAGRALRASPQVRRDQDALRPASGAGRGRGHRAAGPRRDRGRGQRADQPGGSGAARPAGLPGRARAHRAGRADPADRRAEPGHDLHRD